MSTFIYVGSASRAGLRRIDTKRLASELDEIVRGAQLTIGEAHGRPACWVETFGGEVDNDDRKALTAAVEAQAARLRVEIIK